MVMAEERTMPLAPLLFTYQTTLLGLRNINNQNSFAATTLNDGCESNFGRFREERREGEAVGEEEARTIANFQRRPRVFDFAAAAFSRR